MKNAEQFGAEVPKRAQNALQISKDMTKCTFADLWTTVVEFK